MNLKNVNMSHTLDVWYIGNREKRRKKKRIETRKVCTGNCDELIYHQHLYHNQAIGTKR
jgi:hypothetical protein